jgi:type IV pilus assembly protein PilN
MRIAINLATQPYEDARQFWFRWGGAVAGLGLLTLVLVYITATGWANARKDRHVMDQYRQQIAERDKEKADAQALMNLPQNSSTRDRSQFLNDLFYRKAFSWTQVFEDLEKVMPPGLHVVSIHPEVSLTNDLQLKLLVAGASRDRALELVRKMEGSQRFQLTQIESETSEVGTGSAAGDTIQFNVSTLYVPEMEVTGAQRSTH